MKFRKLILNGFKSFVDKTVIEFPDGITGIVGPNGSGKSNILDAVRWVFGEQSAKELRGNDMDDVIFAGSEKRKPSGFAEVALVMGDIDDQLAMRWGSLSEVTIARRFYRTGEREYLINNRKCKLKDIKEIFYDTGIGPKSISIIEQGKVDKIIQAGPEELRYFLEETAGVVKFKEKRKEAERRLTQTWENLSRVNDIIAEITGQMHTLGSQTEAVQKFREMNIRKQELEKQLFSHTVKKHLDELSQVVEEVNRLKVTLTSTIGQFESKAREEREAMARSEELRTVLKEANEKVLEISREITRLEGEIKLLESNIATAEERKQQMQQDMSRLDEMLHEHTANRTRILSGLSEVDDERTTVADKIESLNTIIEDLRDYIADITDTIRSIDSRFLTSSQQMADCRNRIIQMETRQTTHAADIRRLEKERDELSQEADGLTAQLSRMSQEQESTRKELEEILRSIESLKSDRSSISDRHEHLSEKKRDLEIEMTALQQKIALLTEQVESEAFGAKTDAPRIKSLGGALLLDKMKGTRREHQIEAGDIIVFPAARKEEVLKAAEEISSSLRFLFDSDVQEYLAGLTGNSIENISATLYRSGGLYRKVGGDDRSAKILALKSSIESAKRERLEKGEELSDLRDMLETVQEELDELNSVIDEKDRIRRTAEMKVNSLKDKLEHLRQNEERARRRAEIIIRELEFANATKEKNEEEIARLKQKAESLSVEMNGIEEEKTAAEEKRSVLQNDLDDRREELNELKIEERGILEKSSALKKELHLIDRRITEDTDTIRSLKDRLTQLTAVDVVNWQQNLDVIRTTLESEGKKRILAVDHARSVEQEIESLSGHLAALRTEIERENRHVREAEAEINTREIRLAQLRTAIDSVEGQYRDKFGRELRNEFTENLPENFQPRKAKEETDELEKKIAALGPLNMAAEQEYIEVKERYGFLTKQRQDLEDAISSINELINEINDSTVGLFKATFLEVQKNFMEVFGILFGKGHAELKLTEPDNILTSGVEIFVQPPGKKLQNMNLMSGGEKALSAMTLLFAIFLRKPTPFCFLDEIDAPLDDANVDRFLNMVRVLSDRTQFIIITHNHKTMGASDSLYGVTMQEPGVSRILSVRLEAAQAIPH